MTSRSARRGNFRVLLRILLLATLVGAGFWMRSLPPREVAPGLAAWWARRTPAVVTLYFAHGQFVFPVSRRLPSNEDLPRAALQALLAGPVAGNGLTSPIPAGVELRSFKLTDGVAHVDLSSAFFDEVDHGDRQAAEAAIVQTLTRVPGVTSVALRVEGEALRDFADQQMPFLYYLSANGLVAIPGHVKDPRAAINVYLSAPPALGLTSLPADVRLLTYAHDPSEGLLSLNFTYTPSVRALALDRPERMRLLLLGLVASLTEFPQVRAVRIDFEGQSRLGLGECSDLLRIPVARPALLNDERLLGR